MSDGNLGQAASAENSISTSQRMRSWNFFEEKNKPQSTQRARKGRRKWRGIPGASFAIFAVNFLPQPLLELLSFYALLGSKRGVRYP